MIEHRLVAKEGRFIRHHRFSNGAAKFFGSVRQFGQQLIGPGKSVPPRQGRQAAGDQMLLGGRQVMAAAALQKIGKMIEFGLVHAGGCS
jgi:hypothetical protein